MIKKIDNDSITVKMDFDDFALMSGFAGIEEMVEHYDTDTERDAVVLSAEKMSGYFDGE